jgi:hypothetical protein
MLFSIGLLHMHPSRIRPSAICRKLARDYASLQALECLRSPYLLSHRAATAERDIALARRPGDRVPSAATTMVAWSRGKDV